MGNNRHTSRYLTTGLVLVAIGLLVNPWLLRVITSADFSTTVFLALFFLAVSLVFCGSGVLILKNNFLKWFGNKYRDAAIIVLNLIILFFLVNVLASLMLGPAPAEKPVEDDFYDPRDLLTDSIGFMRSVYPGRSDQEIRELLMPDSPYANHPVLEFQEKMQTSRFYNTGFEGLRFDRRLTRKNAPQKINGGIWVFGGSTTFGQGVADNETITAYLNKLDTAHIYLNFGVHAYTQSNEIEKLVLLLKKGYKPEKVIFLDGLNDLIRMIESNFHPLETPALVKSAYTSDYNIATRFNDDSFLRQLPVTRWLHSLFDDPDDSDNLQELPWNKYDNVYDQDNLYNTDPMQHYLLSCRRSPYRELDTLGLRYIVWKLKEFYHANYLFVEKLADAYGFDFSVYYQPQGILSAENPFWRDHAMIGKAPLYRNFNFVVPAIRKQISEWNLPGFFDISSVQDSCPDCYVDLTHYNPLLNQRIAEAILTTEQGKTAENGRDF